jgi:hypothetical protein
VLADFCKLTKLFEDQSTGSESPSGNIAGWNSRPTEALTRNFDAGLLTREEQIELSSLAEIFDRKGISAFSSDEALRFLNLLKKGEGVKETK